MHAPKYVTLRSKENASAIGYMTFGKVYRVYFGVSGDLIFVDDIGRHRYYDLRGRPELFIEVSFKHYTQCITPTTT